MLAIRAHFDGKAIVPDESVSLTREQKVVVLVDSEGTAAAQELEKAIRHYYYVEQSAEERREDAAWGE